jgi:hypothetical protein
VPAALTKHPAINDYLEADQLCWRLSPNILQSIIILRLINCAGGSHQTSGNQLLS